MASTTTRPNASPHSDGTRRTRVCMRMAPMSSAGGSSRTLGRRRSRSQSAAVVAQVATAAKSTRGRALAISSKMQMPFMADGLTSVDKPVVGIPQIRERTRSVGGDRKHVRLESRPSVHVLAQVVARHEHARCAPQHLRLGHVRRKALRSKGQAGRALGDIRDSTGAGLFYRRRQAEERAILRNQNRVWIEVIGFARQAGSKDAGRPVRLGFPHPPGRRPRRPSKNGPR